MTARLEAALAYAARGWPVHPCGAHKKPLTGRGLLDATMDEAQIRAWWRRWPDALVAVATGERAGLVVLDVDIDLANGFSGVDDLTAIGIDEHPETPTAHTPRGGFHCLFRHPGHRVKSVAGKLGPHLDIKADGGYIVVPPRPGGFWDPHLGPDIPLAEMPAWMTIPEPVAVAPPAPTRPPVVGEWGPAPKYSEAALDRACREIEAAPPSTQHRTLFTASLGIGALIAGGAMPAEFARAVLIHAGGKMVLGDPSWPWLEAQIALEIDNGLATGKKRPRTPPEPQASKRQAQ